VTGYTPGPASSRPDGSRLTGQQVPQAAASSAATACHAPVVPLRRFGRPSTYSLSPAELAAHVRQLRRDGWQSWEIRARFDTPWRAA
jgi:hypothetical protein